MITVLPSLRWLDGVLVEKSERIIARQSFEKIKESVQREEEEYKVKRLEGKLRVSYDNRALHTFKKKIVSTPSKKKKK